MQFVHKEVLPHWPFGQIPQLPLVERPMMLLQHSPFEQEDSHDAAPVLVWVADGHAEQLVWPAEDCDCPDGHLVHVLAPSESEKVPAGQSVQMI
jgi:hypothetical protein